MAEAHDHTTIDYAKLIAEVINHNIDRIWSGIVALGGKVAGEVKYQVSNIFSDYLADGADRYSKTKTLLSSKLPVPLYSIYVPMDIRLREGAVKSAGIRDAHKLGRLIVVTGIAGTGKSTFLKHLFIDSLRTKETIPVLIELRRLNASAQDLAELIVETVQLQRVRIGAEYVDRALGSGGFTLLLDAFDELNMDRRDSVRKGILALAEKHPKLHIVMTSRPDPEFVAWSRFAEYQAMKLSKQQALSLVDKLDYDIDVKQKFISELDRTLYNEHESFLSNPLLLTIMLLTYHDNAEIPRKRHLFFASAFNALFSQHDARKEDGGFKRQMRCGLAMDDFQSLLAALSIQSYLDGETTFDRGRALEYIKKAKDITNLKVEGDEYLDDLLKSVCLFMQDGLFLSFTHKQFQEYYTAFFIVHAPSPKQAALIRKVAPSFFPNDVVRILHDMDVALSEKLYVLPAIKSILRKAKLGPEGVDDKFFIRFYQMIIERIAIHDAKDGRPTYFLTSRGAFDLIRFVQTAYQGQVSRLATSSSRERGALKTYLTARSRGGSAGVVLTKELSSDAALLKAVKNAGFLTPEDAKYLIEVRDFVQMRLKRASKSLEDLLG